MEKEENLGEKEERKKAMVIMVIRLWLVFMVNGQGFGESSKPDKEIFFLLRSYPEGYV